MARNRQVSANADQPSGARSHCLTPSRRTSTFPPSPLPSPSLLRLFIPPRVQPHREEWRPTPAGGAGEPQKPRGAVRVAHPRLERAAQPPVLQTQPDFVRTPRAVAAGTQSSPRSGGVQDPQRRASPQAPGRTALRTTSEAPTTRGGPPAHAGTDFSVSRLQPLPWRQPPPAPPTPPAPPPGTRRPKVPAVKMQRAKSVLQIMVSWCWVPSPARAAGEFVGADRAPQAPTAPSPPRGLAVGAQRPGRYGRRAGGEARRTRRGSGSARSAACPPAAGELLLHPSCGSLGPPPPPRQPRQTPPTRARGDHKATPWPSLSRRFVPGARPRAASAGQSGLRECSVSGSVLGTRDAKKSEQISALRNLSRVSVVVLFLQELTVFKQVILCHLRPHLQEPNSS